MSDRLGTLIAITRADTGPESEGPVGPALTDRLQVFAPIARLIADADGTVLFVDYHGPGDWQVVYESADGERRTLRCSA